MTRTQNPTLQLPTERLEQIKAIGSALGLSIAATLGHLVRGEIAKGTIADTLPGVSIQRNEGGVVIGFDDDGRQQFDLDGAKSLAALVNDYTGAGKLAKLINLDHNFMVERQGNGVKVTILFPAGVTKNFSFDVARDFARLVSEAAK